MSRYLDIMEIYMHSKYNVFIKVRTSYYFITDEVDSKNQKNKALVMWQYAKRPKLNASLTTILLMNL